MIRTQVQLTDEQARALKALAAERGESIAALIREAVDRLVERRRTDADWERAVSVVGRFSSGQRDVAEEHDRYLADTYID